MGFLGGWAFLVSDVTLYEGFPHPIPTMPPISSIPRKWKASRGRMNIVQREISTKVQVLKVL